MSEGGAPTAPERPLGELVTSTAAVAPDLTVQAVADLFFLDEPLDALAVVDGGRPAGLLMRTKFLAAVFRPFGFELFGRKSVLVVADVAPLVLDATVSLESAMEQAMHRRPENVYDDIIVVDVGGGFRGLVSVKQLVIQQSRVLANAMLREELSRARSAELEALTRIKTQFIANVTHELRSPVNAMIALAELLRDAAEKGHLRQVGDRLALLLSSATHLRSIVTNVLDLSKIEAGRMEVIAEPFALGAVLDEVAETARVLVGAKPVTVEVAIEGELPAADTDPVKVRQVLLNLAVNATKLTQRGSITLRAAAEGDNLRVSVADTGAGIRPEDLGKLFEAFTQLEDPHTKRAEGTGLGLTITRSLTALLGGTIEVASVLGEGTTFTVRFPARYAPKTERSQEP